MLALTLALLGLGSYLAGSIPFGLLIAHRRGIDIRSVGSRNIGATNVFRSVGKGWGLLTFACDAFKGFFAAFLLVRLAAALHLIEGAQVTGAALLCACLAVAGHNWPVFLKFKGGKGVAVTVGALLGIQPLAMGIGFAIWLGVFLLTRYVSLASLLAALAVCLYMWWARSPGDLLLPAVMSLLAGLIVWRHKANILRLANGTENRFAFGRPKAS